MHVWINFQQLMSGVVWFKLTQINGCTQTKSGARCLYIFQTSHGLNTVMLRHDKPAAEVLGGRRGLDPSMAPLSFATLYGSPAVLLSRAK